MEKKSKQRRGKIQTTSRETKNLLKDKEKWSEIIKEIASKEDKQK